MCYNFCAPPDCEKRALDESKQSAQNTGSGQQIASPNTPENPVPTTPATAQQLEQAETRIEERMSSFERSMIRLTRYGLFVTIVTGVIFAGQLYEMITGGTATDKLVEYSKTQAGASSDQADAAQQFSDTAEDINGRMAEAVDQLEASAASAQKQAGASLDASKTAQQALEFQTRPWISLQNVRPTEGYRVPDPNAPDNWHVTYDVVNTGYSPAVRAVVWGFITINKGIYASFRRDAPCEESDKRSNDLTFPSLTIFRGDPVVNRDDWVFSFKPGETPTVVLGMDSLVICISYRDASTHKLHHTKMLFYAKEGAPYHQDGIPHYIQPVEKFVLQNAETN